MYPTRFTEPDHLNQNVATATGFLLFSVAPTENAPASSMQWFYQRMYEEAVKASQPKPMATRDLFAVMN
jgi:hypothetical protein